MTVLAVTECAERHIHAVAAPLQDFLRSGCDLEVSLKDLRLLLPTLSADAAAIAGQAVALSQWHQVGC